MKEHEINGLLAKAIETIRIQTAEIERLQRKNNELEIELKAMRGAANSYKAEVKKINFLLKEAWESIEQKDRRTETIKSEAYKEFAERLCKGRVSNDPVVIAVKAELSEVSDNA